MAIVSYTTCPQCHGPGLRMNGATCDLCKGSGKIPVHSTPDDKQIKER
jgi:DnaJ-class molecular chaperone